MTSTARKVFLIILVFSALYFAYIPLHPDEAYYWLWSKHLALSYFDGPPLIAYLIKMSTVIFGNTAVAIKIVCIVCVAISTWVIYRLAEQMFSPQVAEKTLIIFLLLPITQTVLIATTLDAPLMLFWSLTLYFFWQWINTNSLKSLYFTAIFAGLGLLSKYTMILIFPALFIYLIVSPYRKRLLNPHVYFAALLTIAIFSPVIIWNLQHHFISFEFQWHHGAGATIIKLHDIIAYLLGQLANFNPIFFIALIFLAIKYRRDFKDQRLQFLLWPFLFCYLFFLYQAASNLSQMNWTMPAYISASILLGYLIDKKPHRFIYYTGIILSVVVVILLKFPELTPGWEHKTPIRRFFGYQPLIQQIQPIYLNPMPTILSNERHNASELSFYLPGQPAVNIITPTRQSEFDQWSKKTINEIKQGDIKQALYIGPRGTKTQLENYFKKCQLVQTLNYNSAMITRNWVVYQCSQ